MDEPNDFKKAQLELMGVLADYDNDRTFDATSYATVQRVISMIDSFDREDDALNEEIKTLTSKRAMFAGVEVWVDGKQVCLGLDETQVEYAMSLSTTMKSLASHAVDEVLKDSTDD